MIFQYELNERRNKTEKINNVVPRRPPTQTPHSDDDITNRKEKQLKDSIYVKNHLFRLKTTIKKMQRGDFRPNMT
ncbi:unnamed protein product [Trifolium pratense]|uniref:Uncharacterized protein n=1 Tax=Trifolium pratense TaxID=57577 RepID=A0ACB0KDR8_TRIPR|nr:unnamed protein product [Trifolium pratense]